MNFERRGSGEPLVLLHHLGGEWQVFEPVLDRLADGLRRDRGGHAGLRRLAGAAGLASSRRRGRSRPPWPGCSTRSASSARTPRGSRSAAGCRSSWRSAAAPCRSPRCAPPASGGGRSGRARAISSRTVARAAGARSCRCCSRIPAVRARALRDRGRARRPAVARAQAVRGRARLRPRAATTTARASTCAATCSRGAEEIDVPVTLAWGEHDRQVTPPRSVAGRLAPGGAARLQPPADARRPRAGGRGDQSGDGWPSRRSIRRVEAPPGQEAERPQRCRHRQEQGRGVPSIDRADHGPDEEDSGEHDGQPQPPARGRAEGPASPLASPCRAARHRHEPRARAIPRSGSGPERVSGEARAKARNRMVSGWPQSTLAPRAAEQGEEGDGGRRPCE